MTLSCLSLVAAALLATTDQTQPLPDSAPDADPQILLMQDVPIQELRLAADSTAGEAAGLAQLVAAMQKRYEGTSSFEARFAQTYHSKVFRRTERSEGLVVYQKPGKMRFDYSAPTAKTFLVDGKALWVIEPAAKQAMVNRCFKEDALTSSLTFLFGQGDLQVTFDITEAEGAPAGVRRLVLDPKQAQGAYRRLLLDVDPKTARVVASTVIDHQGNLNRFEFSDARYDSTVAPDRFAYTPAKGVIVSQMPGSCLEPR